MRWYAALLVLVLGAAGCGGDKNHHPTTDDDTTDEDLLPPRARIRVVHASPDAGTLTIFATPADGSPEQLFDGAPLAYTGYSGPQSVEAEIATVLEARNLAGTTVFTAQPATFAKDKTYLVILAGYASAASKPVAEAQSLTAIVLEEGLIAPEPNFAQVRFVNAALDAPSLALADYVVFGQQLEPFFSTLPFGAATPMAGGGIAARNARRFGVYSPERVETIFTVDVALSERYTAIVVGSRGVPHDALDGLQLLLVPAVGTLVANPSPVPPDATIYFVNAYPVIGPVSFVLGFFDQYTLDQEPTTDGVQLTQRGQVTPRWFVAPGASAMDRKVTISHPPAQTSGQLPPLLAGSTNVFVYSGFEFPGVGQQPLTQIGPLPLTPLPVGAASSVTVAQAGSDSSVLTFRLATTGFDMSTPVNFGGYDTGTMRNVPTSTDIALSITEASFNVSFSLIPSTRYLLLSYGTAAPTGYSFACALLPFAPNGALGTVVTLAE